MEKDTEKILKYTPYNTYSDLFGAVFSNKATIRLSNSACRQIAEIEKPIFANFGLHLGIIPSVIMTIIFAVCASNYWLLLLLLLELVFPLGCYLFNNLKIKTWIIAAIIVVCDLFIFELPNFLLITALSWIICSLIVRWWSKKIYIMSVKILRYNEDAFVWAFNSHNLFIEDCYGNIYNKQRNDKSETDAYERLLKILQIGTGAENIDDAIRRFSTFYLNKGKEIPEELYIDIEHLSKQFKYEKLLKILELGIGTMGIENVTNRLIDFYKAKGVNFPNNI